VNARFRAWSRLRYLDPEPVLRELRALEMAFANANLSDRVRRLRTNALKTERETREALIFAYGMSFAIGTRVYVAPGETEDCDFITSAVAEDTRYYTCVQLKELAPEDLNATHTLHQLMSGLGKRPKSSAVLAVHLNRGMTIGLAELAQARAPFAEVWFFWASSPTLDEWCLFGDVLESPRLWSFSYPGPEVPSKSSH
jgi:hypothetical protein